MKNTELDFDWSALPKWAKYIAMDEDGLWYFYIAEPRKGEDHWANSYGFDDGIVPKDYTPKNFTGDWEESLFEVPKNKMK